MNLSDNRELGNWKKEQLDKAIYEAQVISPLVWIYINKAISERGIPISFKDHKYLIQPWNDLSPKQVYMKSAQMGISVMMILLEWLCERIFPRSLSISFTDFSTSAARE